MSNPRAVYTKAGKGEGCLASVTDGLIVLFSSLSNILRAVENALLLYEPYANESSQICPFLAVRPQFESVHNQHRRLSSHSYSHQSVICFGINIFFKLRRVCVFLV